MTNFIKLKKIVQVSITVLQLLLTFIVLFMHYSFTSSYGIINEFTGTLSFISSPFIYTLVVVVISMIIIAMIGLPIRFHKKLHIWWKGKIFLVPKMLLFALFLSLLQFFPAFADWRSSKAELYLYNPVYYIFLLNWFLLGFGFLHYYPPYMLQMRFLDWLEKKQWITKSF